MKRNDTMRWMLFLLVCTFSYSTFAQVRGDTYSPEQPILGTIINGGNFGPPVSLDPLIVDRSCTYNANFSVLVANLQPDGRGRYMFPQGEYPAMILRITVGNVQTCYPITEFLPYAVAGYSNVFYSAVSFPVDVANECANNTPNASGGSLTASVGWSAELMLDNGLGCGNLSTYYPVCFWSEPGNLFACDVFSFSNQCPVANCVNSVEAVHSGTFDIDCGLCTGRITPEILVEHARTKSIGNEAFTVAPNPFWNTFMLSWDVKKAVPRRIELTNLQGQLIRSWEASSLEGQQWLEVDAGDFPSGVYFVNFLYEDQMLAKKIVKQ
ncbi:MAG: T9SS type A sorting domain-containing protein [Bacteroidota bacterium]